MADAYTRAIDKVTFRDFLDAISPTPVVGDAVSGLLGLYDTGKGLFGDYKAAQEKDPRKMIRGMAGNVDNYTSGLLNAASVVPLVSPAIAGMFIGKNSKGWDALKADEAQKMLAAGVDPKEVWRKTGTFKGVDGALRQEIDDSQSFPKVTGTAKKIDDIIDHPKLFESYPDISNIGYLQNTDMLFGGAYQPAKINSDGMAKELVNTGDRRNLSLTLHELQHAVQEREAFASGGNVFEFDESIPLNGEEIIKGLRRKTYSELDIKNLMNKYGVSTVDELKNKAYEMASMRPQDMYRRLAGEAEARLTQSRMNMTMPNRLQVYPYDMLDAPQDQLIVKGLIGP